MNDPRRWQTFVESTMPELSPTYVTPQTTAESRLRFLVREIIRQELAALLTARHLDQLAEAEGGWS